MTITVTLQCTNFTPSLPKYEKYETPKVWWLLTQPGLANRLPYSISKTLALPQFHFLGREALGGVDSESRPGICFSTKSRTGWKPKKSTESCPDSYPLSRNSTMEHSVRMSCLSFINPTKISSHTQKEIKGKVGERECSVHPVVSLHQPVCPFWRVSPGTSPHHEGGHVSLRMCHLPSLIPQKCPSQPLKLGTSLKKHIDKYIKMCVECLAEEGSPTPCFVSSRQWRSSQGLGESQTCFCWRTIV